MYNRVTKMAIGGGSRVADGNHVKNAKSVKKYCLTSKKEKMTNSRFLKKSYIILICAATFAAMTLLLPMNGKSQDCGMKALAFISPITDLNILPCEVSFFNMSDYAGMQKQCEWHFGDGSEPMINCDNLVSHIYTNQGIYQPYLVIISLDLPNCRDTAYIDLTIGVTDILENNISNIQIYPNPAKNSFFIDTEKITTVKLYDVSGKEVLNQTANSKTEINISHLPQGIYNVQIFSNEKIIGSSKIVKQ